MPERFRGYIFSSPDQNGTRSILDAWGYTTFDDAMNSVLSMSKHDAMQVVVQDVATNQYVYVGLIEQAYIRKEKIARKAYLEEQLHAILDEIEDLEVERNNV